MSLLLLLGVAYLRSSVLAGRCLPAVLTSTCGAIASTAGVNLSLPPVAPAEVPAIFHPRVGDIYLRWGRDVYLRCFWCLPPVVSPTLGWNNAGTSAGATGGILKRTPAECRRNHRRYTPNAVRHKHFCPTGGKCPKSTAGRCQHRR